MRYILFLFFVSSIVFSQSAFADWASNKTCAPIMQDCMKKYAAKYGSEARQSQAAKDALGLCNVTYGECANDNGVILQKGGSYAQLYHPQNTDFMACKKIIEDISSDAFAQCMRNPILARTPPKVEPLELKPMGVILARCSKQNPEKCTSFSTCMINNGVWLNEACVAATCPDGAIADTLIKENCRCLSNIGVSIERGTGQVCPSSCSTESHQVYNSETKRCGCAEGYEDRTGIGTCVTAAPSQPTNTVECLQELQEKANSCNSTASTAVDQCNPDRQNDDTIGALQNLLKGSAGAMSASQGCAQAAVAGSTGYYALDELRGKCDTEIGTCKTTCSDATSYINANKDRVYQACRKKEYTYYRGDGFTCRMDDPFSFVFTEAEWNAEWDKINKAKFDEKIQQMQTSVADNNTKCQSGTAVTNREKVNNYMNDMDNTFKTASQCECQLNSSSANCANLAGLKDCAADPTLAGCANVAVNCLNASDTSPKCVCFRDPNGAECKKIQAAVNFKPNSNLNGFVGAGSGGSSGGVGVGDSSSDGPTGVNLSGDDLKNLNSAEMAAGDASGTATADNGSPFAPANGGGNSGVNGNFGSGEANSTQAGDDSIKSKLGGMFNSAKGAIGNLFGGKKNNSEATKSGAYGNGLDANGNPMDPKKWRPGKMVRGLASGGDTELAGKFEDIWKVVNRQYKVQDQRDNFIFGDKK